VKSIKTLGVAIMMALALTAFAGAGTASANYFKAAVEPQKWNGEPTGNDPVNGKKHSLYIGASLPPFICSEVAFSGETKAKSISDLRVSPQLGNCEHMGAGKTSWQMNGCQLRFKPGPGPSLVGTVDIVGCTKPMRSETWGCWAEIGNQNGLGKVEYENTTSGGVPAVKVIAKLTGITYTRYYGPCVPSTNGTFSDGTYQGEWLVKGATVPGGTAAAAEIQSATVASPRFNAEEGPATLSGIGTNPVVLNFPTAIPGNNNGQVYCESATYSGTASLVPTEAISLVPTFHGCFVSSFKEGKETSTWVIADKDITAGACSYQLQAKGGFAIVGASCAASPIKITTPGCVLKLGPQSGFPGPTFSNSGSGTLRKVTVSHNTNTKGLTYTAEGAGCVTPGTIAAAVPRPNMSLSAKDSSGAAQGLWVE
jgi:hypothetical protein